MTTAAWLYLYEELSSKCHEEVEEDGSCPSWQGSLDATAKGSTEAEMEPLSQHCMQKLRDFNPCVLKGDCGRAWSLATFLLCRVGEETAVLAFAGLGRGKDWLAE